MISTANNYSQENKNLIERLSSNVFITRIFSI
jgi:hypothetical protein